MPQQRKTNRKNAIVVVTFLALLLHNPAHAADITADIAGKTVREDVFPKSTVRFPGGVVARPDIEYANLTGFRPLLLDLYVQEPSPSPRPLVIWIHGGGWNRGDSRTSGAYADFPAVLASLAARGYVVASVNYRLSGEAKFPAAVQDVKAAVRYLRTNAGRYGIDPARVILWGGSAGGHLAALAAASCGVAAFEPAESTGRLPKSEAGKSAAPPVSDCVQGAVVWYGFSDFAAYAAQRKAESPDAKLLSGLGEFLGCEPADCPAVAARASPASYVGSATPPMLLIHGQADRTAPVEQAQELAALLKTAGRPVETLLLPEIDHGFIGTSPPATRDASLLALRRSFDFIDRIAGGAE
jgi:acetyl esterase/lipase